jgi:hypothetical protein
MGPSKESVLFSKSILSTSYSTFSLCGGAGNDSPFFPFFPFIVILNFFSNKLHYYFPTCSHRACILLSSDSRTKVNSCTAFFLTFRKKICQGQAHKWLTPIILATWEAEFRESVFKAKPGQIV